ncbi:MAG: DUF1573 domain-containing protein [Bacteroidota bacterium]
MKALVFLFALFITGALCGQTDTTLRPIAVFDKLTWNFGDVPQNKQYSHAFYLFNKGTAPLVITSVIGTGGGQVPSYSKEPIMPGDSSPVRIIYGAFTVGMFTKVVVVSTNAGDFTLTIKGNVFKVDSTDFKFEKTLHDFEQVIQPGRIICEFTVQNTGRYPLFIDKVTSSSGNMMFTWPQNPIPAGESGTIRATLEPNLGAFFKTGIVNIAGYDTPIILHLKGEGVLPAMEAPIIQSPSQK